MLELKFAIYYRAASLRSQASYAALAEKSQALFNIHCTPTVFLNQQFCVIIRFFLLRDLCACVHVKNKSDISYLKTSRAFDVLIHSGKPNSVG